MKAALRCLLLCGILLTGAACKNYAGPVVDLQGGWRDGGPFVGVRLSPWSRLTGEPTLKEAADTYAILTQEDGSSGKIPVKVSR
jgi:hypothetical protein